MTKIYRSAELNTNHDAESHLLCKNELKCNQMFNAMGFVILTAVQRTLVSKTLPSVLETSSMYRQIVHIKINLS